MDFDQPTITKKRSLGALRKAEKTKAQSPDMTGLMRLQRHTLETISQQLDETGGDEIVMLHRGLGKRRRRMVNILQWRLSPRFVKRAYRPTYRKNLNFIFGDERTRSRRN